MEVPHLHGFIMDLITANEKKSTRMAMFRQ
jgi:hypothetical protein